MVGGEARERVSYLPLERGGVVEGGWDMPGDANEEDIRQEGMGVIQVN